MERGRRILFTGISGLRMQESLEKLAQFAHTSFGRAVKVIGAEDYFTKEVATTGLLPELTNSAERTILSLGLPKPILKGSWERAFTTTTLRHSPLTEAADIFMHMHACFYH